MYLNLCVVVIAMMTISLESKYFLPIWFHFTHVIFSTNLDDAPPSSLIDSNVNMRQNIGRVRSWGHAPWLVALWGQRGVLELRDGTRKNDKHLITQTNLHTNHGQTWTHKTHHGPDLREATTFPLIIYFMPLHEAHIQMAFCPETPKWESRNSQSWDSCDFGAA